MHPMPEQALAPEELSIAEQNALAVLFFVEPPCFSLFSALALVGLAGKEYCPDAVVVLSFSKGGLRAVKGTVIAERVDSWGELAERMACSSKVQSQVLCRKPCRTSLANLRMCARLQR